MTKNTVLHIVQSLNFGGVESHIRTIALNAHESSYNHSFVAVAHGGSVADELLAAKLPVRLMNMRSKIPSPSALWALITEIRAQRPSILHCHGAEANFHGLIAGRICGVPVCLAEEIGFPQHSRKAQIVFRYIYMLADAVVAVSEGVKRRLVELGEVTPERAYVLLNPTHVQSKRTRPKLSSQFEVGFIGRLEEVKNPLALVRAAALLRDRGLAVRLVIVGDGSQQYLLKKEVKQLNLEGLVELTGFDSRPFDRLKNIALYVQPSISEGFGLALVEAMTAEIPVLATSVGGTPEIIVDNENGWLLSGTDPMSIADGIQRCAAMDTETLERIGRNGRSSVVKRFSSTAYFSACDVFYTRLLEGCGR